MRLARLEVPERNVKVAVPSVPVVTVCVLKIPVSLDKVTTTPGRAAFVELTAVTVTVVDAELSEGTVALEAERVTVAAVVVAVVVAVLLVVEDWLPLEQPTKTAAKAPNIKNNNDLA